MPFCPNCGQKVSTEARFCEQCGQRLATPPPPQDYPPKVYPTPPNVRAVGADIKNTGVAAILAFFFGIFFFGIGHIYVGRVGRGIALLFIGIIAKVFLLLILFGSILASGLLGLYNPSFSIIAISFSIIWIWVIIGINVVLWIWQIFDAYNLARKYNEYVWKYGTAPW